MAPPLYLWLEEKCTGPYTVVELNAFLKEGKIGPDHPSWMEGLAEWIPVTQLLEKVARLDKPSPGSNLPGISGKSTDSELEAKVSSLMQNVDRLDREKLEAETRVHEEHAARQQVEVALKKALEENARLKQALERENAEHEKAYQALVHQAQRLEEEARTSKEKLEKHLQLQEELNRKLREAEGALIRHKTELGRNADHRSQVEQDLRGEQDKLRKELMAAQAAVLKTREELEQLTRVRNETQILMKSEASSGNMGDVIRKLEEEKEKLATETKRLQEKIRRDAEINATFLQQFEEELKKDRKEEK